MAKKLMKEDRKEFQSVAETALYEKNYQLAVEIFSKLYSEKRSARENYLFAQALVGVGDYSKALTIIQEYMNSYLAENERLVFYIHVAVFAGESLKVSQLLKSLKEFLTEQESQLFYATLSSENELFNKQEGNKLLKLKKQLQYLGALDPLEQRKIAKKAVALSCQDFVLAVKGALEDDNVHPLVRASLLNDLRLLDVQEEFAYHSFLNGRIAVTPGRLEGLQQTEVFKSYAAQVLGDPSRPSELSQQILGEITLKLMLLYPVFTDVEQDEELWYYILLNDQRSLNSAGDYGQIALKMEKSILELELNSK